MKISCFDELLFAAKQQDLPQRLLLVFATAELPADSTPEQRRRFEEGAGGALVPNLCVDKTPEEIENFAELKIESKQFNTYWQVIFASTQTDDPDDIQASRVVAQALERMVTNIKSGDLANMIAFDLHGNALSLQ